MTSPNVTKHIISLKLSDTYMLWFKVFAFKISLFQKFFFKLKHCFMNFALCVEWVIWNVVRRPSFGNEHFKVKKFAADRRLNVSETDDFLSTKICFENTLSFFGDGSDRLAHPISQVNSVFFRIQFCLGTNVLFQLCNGSVWIENFLDHGVFWELLELRL